jgi:hypothetical protein
LLDAILGMPGNVVAVGKDSRAQGGTIVATNPNKHETAIPRDVSDM